MLRNRVLILVGGCLLAASAAWADGVGYIDCSSHPDGTPVFGKPRRTPDTVASLPCGERFTILLNGFIFSRIQTKDGAVGYVYSNLLSLDRSGAVVQQPASAPLTAAASKPASTSAADAQPKAIAPAPPQAAATQARPEVPAAASSVSTAAAPAVQPNSITAAQTQPAAVQPAPAQAFATPSRATEGPTIVPSTSVASTSAATEQPQAVPGQPAAAEAATPAPAASVSEAPAAVTPADPGPAAQPEPSPAEPVRPAVQPANARESWERPNAGGVRHTPLIELFGGYGFARFDNGAGVAASNLHGVMGSFGWNIRPWLQIVADSSYNVVTVSGTKNVLYGNHWGPRIFRRVRNRWGLTPFVEGLVGGSRADTTISGAGGYQTSTNCISYKVGGGLDIKPSRHFEIRLLDVDYYRTSFGTNLHQGNIWASAGIVIRLFGGSE
ncbi:MAG: hypothetical protein JWO71_1219 [Candidatus Acidoferrum typicum]|nr:hypothetical protein [Candidatus Acidoferrum typicum]